MQLPLLDVVHSPEMNRRRGLASTISGLDPEQIANAFRSTVGAAPKRTDEKERFLVGHDGRGGTASLASERVRAKAIFNAGSITIDGEAVEILDYEVPLRSALADSGVGDIDLLGVDSNNRLWIIELKVGANRDTPLKAILQCLTYVAIVEANWKEIAREITDLTGRRPSRPPVLCLAADTQYWNRIRSTKAAGDWLEPLRGFNRKLSDATGISFSMIDIGVQTTHLDGTARPRLIEDVHGSTL